MRWDDACINDDRRADKSLKRSQRHSLQLSGGVIAMQTHFEYSSRGDRSGRRRGSAIDDIEAHQALSAFSSRLRDALGPQSWTSWGAGLRVGASDAGSVRVYAPTSLHCERLIENVGARRLRAMWEEVDPTGRALDLRVDPEAGLRTYKRSTSHPAVKTGARPAESPADVARKAPAASTEPKTFDNFIEGPANKYAYAAAKSLATEDEAPFRLLVLCGSYGSGKSHLLEAIAHKVAEDDARSVMSCNADGFRADFVKSISSKKGVDFKERMTATGVLVIDDTQILDKAKKTQEELANVVNQILSAGGRVVVAADRPIEDIAGLDSRLAARFAGAVSCKLDQPDLDHRRRILQKMASMNPVVKRGVDIPDAVLDYMAAAIVGMPRDLEAALGTVITRTALIGLPITLETARDALGDLLNGAAKRVTVEDIQKAVAAYHGMPVSTLLSKRRTRDIVRPRQEAMFLCKELTNRSLPDIGRRFGDMDHTTVMHACKRIAKLIDDNANVRSDIEALRRLLRQRRDNAALQ